MPKATCSVPGCDRPATAHKMCEGHRARWRKHGDVQADVPLGTRQPRTGHCSVEGCALPIQAKGMCNAHYHRALKHGDANADRPISTKIPDGMNWCPNCRTTKPLAEGGSNWPANLRPACRHCNAVKKDAWPYPTKAQRAA